MPVKTIKTAVVVVLLLAVLYGLYVVLNKPEDSSSGDSAWPQPGPLQIDSGTLAVGEPSRGAELVDKPGSFPPEMPSDPPENFGGEFNAGGEPAGAALPPAAKKPASQGPSAYASKADSTPMADKFVRPAGGAASARSLAPKAFADAWRAASRQMQEGRYRQALATLTVFYDSPDLTADEQRQLLDVLDPLAGKVIYSTEHLLESPHDVTKGENLYDVAKQCQVPWLLLKNINSIEDPEILLPGTRLKVLRGPFRAEVKVQSGSQGELTLFLGDLYAGRFPVTIGNDRPLRPGRYEVAEKQEWPPYYGPNGSTLPAKHPQNPLGRWWLSLGTDVAIHSSPTAPGGQRGLGSISLSPIDAADVYGILTVGAKVEIR
jgi:hypothetical protein